MADDDFNISQDTPTSNDNIFEVKNNKYILKERFEIDYSTPLEWLDNNGASAYKVEDKIDPEKKLFALICNNETAPRSAYLPYLKSIDNINVMKLVEFGIVSTPFKNSRNMALIYRTPLGGKVFEKGITQLSLKDQPEKIKTIILGLLSAAEILKGHNISHRAIRADNLYYRNSDKKEIVIGDCLASFPAFHQPPAYETIESLLANKEGRGNGTDKNDIYAIGAVIISLFLGHELLQDLTTPEILRLKIKKGSFNTIIGEEKIPNQYSSIFKGLLIDQEEQRWSYVQAYNILEGKINNNNAVANSEKPKKSITINGEKVFTSRDVAISMLNHPTEAFELLKNGKITDWAKNGIENEKLAAKIDKLISTSTDNVNYNEILISKICICIAPYLPLKINDISVFPDATPKAIFYTIKNNGDLKPFYNLFSSDLIKQWYLEQENLRSPANIAEFKMYIERKDIGYGIDRIMYDFDDDLPCLSPLLGDEFVNSATKVLKALDNNYSTKQNTLKPYDKTIIAYLRCKMGKKIDGILIDLNSNKEEIQASAILRLYTNMQNKFGPAKLPNLTKWLVSSSMKIIKSYHNIKFQKALERELLKVNKNGKLYEILEILENEETRQKDRTDYAKALSDVNYLHSEKNKIINGNYKLDEDAKYLALKFASILSILTMISSFIFNLIIWVLK